MAITKLDFGKLNWNNRDTFPTVQPDEAKARADMQRLFDFIRDYINNTLLPNIPDGVTRAILDMNAYRITEVGAPIETTDAATKEYVDGYKSKVATAIIDPGKWVGSSSPYTQNIDVQGVDANSIVDVALPKGATATQVTEYNALILQDGGQSLGQITLRCFGKKNTTTIPINIVVRR